MNDAKLLDEIRKKSKKLGMTPEEFIEKMGETPSTVTAEKIEGVIGRALLNHAKLRDEIDDHKKRMSRHAGRTKEIGP